MVLMVSGMFGSLSLQMRLKGFSGVEDSSVFGLKRLQTFDVCLGHYSAAV